MANITIIHPGEVSALVRYYYHPDGSVKFVTVRTQFDDDELTIHFNNEDELSDYQYALNKAIDHPIKVES